jgi:hypothetical protein
MRNSAFPATRHRAKKTKKTAPCSEIDTLNRQNSRPTGYRVRKNLIATFVPTDTRACSQRELLELAFATFRRSTESVPRRTDSGPKSNNRCSPFQTVFEKRIEPCSVAGALDGKAFGQLQIRRSGSDEPTLSQAAPKT